MTDRKYTIAEIDRIRRAVAMREDATTYANRAYYPDERMKYIEEITRTYLLAGADPEEVEKAASDAVAQMRK